MSSQQTATVTVVALERRLRRSRILNVVLGAVAVFLLIVSLARPSSFNTAGETPSSTPGSTATRGSESASDSESRQIAHRDPDDPLAMGDVDAPVVLVEYGDMRCPYCAVFSRQTLPTILKDYVATGKVRYEFRDVSFFGDQSTDAAVALRAAAEQGRLHKYLTAVYATAPENSHPDLPTEKLIAFAKEAGVPDLAKFASDLTDTGLRATVEESTATAQTLGVNSVPFFVAGDKAVSGAQPMTVFTQLLDDQLKAAGAE